MIFVGRKGEMLAFYGWIGRMNWAERNRSLLHAGAERGKKKGGRFMQERTYACHRCGNEFSARAGANPVNIARCSDCHCLHLVPEVANGPVLSEVDIVVLARLRENKSIDQAFDEAKAPTEDRYRIPARERLLVPGSDRQVRPEVLDILRHSFTRPVSARDKEVASA